MPENQRYQPPTNTHYNMRAVNLGSEMNYVHNMVMQTRVMNFLINQDPDNTKQLIQLMESSEPMITSIGVSIEPLQLNLGRVLSQFLNEYSKERGEELSFPGIKEGLLFTAMVVRTVYRELSQIDENLNATRTSGEISFNEFTEAFTKSFHDNMVRSGLVMANSQYLSGKNIDAAISASDKYGFQLQKNYLCCLSDTELIILLRKKLDEYSSRKEFVSSIIQEFTDTTEEATASMLRKFIQSVDMPSGYISDHVHVLDELEGWQVELTTVFPSITSLYRLSTGEDVDLGRILNQGVMGIDSRSKRRRIMMKLVLENGRDNSGRYLRGLKEMHIRKQKDGTGRPDLGCPGFLSKTDTTSTLLETHGLPVHSTFIELTIRMFLNILERNWVDIQKYGLI